MLKVANVDHQSCLSLKAKEACFPKDRLGPADIVLLPLPATPALLPLLSCPCSSAPACTTRLVMGLLLSLSRLSPSSPPSPSILHSTPCTKHYITARLKSVGYGKAQEVEKVE
jgi:hypothetical protein